jgi:integrase
MGLALGAFRCFDPAGPPAFWSPEPGDMESVEALVLPSAVAAALAQPRPAVAGARRSRASGNHPRREVLRAPLSDDEFLSGVQRLEKASPAPILALALFYVLASTGLWQLEVASLTISDVVQRDGRLRESFDLAGGGVAEGDGRVVHLRSGGAIAALEAYLAERVRRRQGMCADTAAYRGLDPASPQFVDERGRRLPVVRAAGRQQAQRTFCRGMHQLCRQVFRHTGIAGLTVELCRRSLAWRLACRGATHEQIGQALGVRDAKAVRALLRHPAPELPTLFTNLVP